MKKILPILLLILIACNNATEQNQAPADSASASIHQDSSSGFVYNFTDSVLQNRIEDTLLQLAFVKESNRYIDSISNHKKGLSFITDTANQEISVTAGYNGADRFEPYYHFSIHPKTFQIKIMDDVTGDFIPVSQYLKKSKDYD